MAAERTIPVPVSRLPPEIATAADPVEEIVTACEQRASRLAYAREHRERVRGTPEYRARKAREARERRARRATP